jgi:hypothetical protein
MGFPSRHEPLATLRANPLNARINANLVLGQLFAQLGIFRLKLSHLAS